MPITRRIYVSLPADRWLPPNLNKLKWAIVEEIEKLGHTPEIFTNPKGRAGLASAKTWTPRDANVGARRCIGAVIIGMPRWVFQDKNKDDVLLPTEFNHYEGALAHTLGLPTLVLVQEKVLRRVVFDMTFAGYIGDSGRMRLWAGCTPTNFAFLSNTGRTRWRNGEIFFSDTAVSLTELPPISNASY